jgi:hypothetical protein
MGTALLDENVRQQLLHNRSDTLLAEFSLSKQTRSWLRAVQATTLEELAQAILPLYIAG